MPATGYADIGVYQHKAEGGDAAKTGYVDIGVYQHADSLPTSAGGFFLFGQWILWASASLSWISKGSLDVR